VNIQHRGQHLLMSESGSLGERIKALHEKLLDRVPVIDRIACVLHEPGTDMLKTFINSTRVGVPINGYEFHLRDSASLSHLASSGEFRVIDDIPRVVNPNSPHSSWLLEQGYRSSFTLPMYDMGNFMGLMFFNSMLPDAFTPSRQRDILMYANLLTMAITTEREAVRSILNSANVAREIAKLRDFETGAHLERMALYSRLIAKEVASQYELSDEWIEHVFLFAPLHDIGKIGIPDVILLKPGKLDPQERAIMETHVELGLSLAERVLDRIGVRNMPDSSVMTNIIGGHHEFMDGSGYPKGLSGDAIPIEARIVTVADIFDALTSHRPYKEPWTIADALAELARLEAAGKLDPACVAALTALSGEAERIRDQYPDHED